MASRYDNSEEPPQPEAVYHFTSIEEGRKEGSPPGPASTAFQEPLVSHGMKQGADQMELPLEPAGLSLSSQATPMSGIQVCNNRVWHSEAEFNFPGITDLILTPERLGQYLKGFGEHQVKSQQPKDTDAPVC